MTGQSRLSSATESVANVAIGYGVAVLAQSVIFPVFGLQASPGEHMAIAGLFTVVSLVRSYWVRRLFNRIGARPAPTDEMLDIVRAHIQELRAAGRTEEAARLHYAIEAALL